MFRHLAVWKMFLMFPVLSCTDCSISMLRGNGGGGAWNDDIVTAILPPPEKYVFKFPPDGFGGAFGVELCFILFILFVTLLLPLSCLILHRLRGFPPSL